MVTITISELISSSLTDIDTDEISLIKGGIISRELVDAVPGLEGVRGLFLTPEVLDDINSLSFGEIRDLFDFIPVVNAEEVPTPSPQFTRRRRFF